MIFNKLWVYGLQWCFHVPTILPEVRNEVALFLAWYLSQLHGLIKCSVLNNILSSWKSEKVNAKPQNILGKRSKHLEHPRTNHPITKSHLQTKKTTSATPHFIRETRLRENVLGTAKVGGKGVSREECVGCLYFSPTSKMKKLDLFLGVIVFPTKTS